MYFLKYFATLTFLGLSLALTIYAIVALKQGHMNSFWTSLGVGTNQPTLNWCDNRVQSIKIPEPTKASVVEENGQWLWKNQHTVILDYLSVEKWFAKYCQLPINKIDFKDFDARLKPLLEVEFVDGGTTTFYDLGEGRVQIEDHVFTSPTLTAALKDLLDFGPKVQ